MSVVCARHDAAPMVLGAFFFVFLALLSPASAGTLTLVTSSGVAGSPLAQTPAAQVQTFQSGESVAYSYTPTAGFSAAVVVLDGQIVANSGTIAMSADHWLFAYGSSETGTSFPDMVTVPSDPTKITYPQIYQNRVASAAKVDDAYCASTSETVSFPASYLGSFPLPAIAGAPLAPTVKRGAAIKDVWQSAMTRPTQNLGCTGDLHKAIIATLQRLQAMGIDHIAVFRDTQVVDMNAATLSILPNASWSISLDEMKWITSTARSFGMAVHEYRSVVTNDTKNNILPPAPTQEWLTRFLDAYTTFLVDRAREAEANGIEAFQLDFLFYYFPDPAPFKPLLVQKFIAAAKAVRAVYSGKLVFGR